MPITQRSVSKMQEIGAKRSEGGDVGKERCGN